MEKLYYTIGEVAETLGESVSLVRFWSDTFSKYIQPMRNNKGNRMYKEEDIDFLREVHYLVKDCGLSLDVAEKKLRNEGEAVAKRTKAVATLRGIRAQLTEIRKSL